MRAGILGVVKMVEVEVEVAVAVAVAVVAATLAAAHAHPTLANHGKTPGTETVVAVGMAAVANRAVSVAHKARDHRTATRRAYRATKSSAKTHAAHV